MKEEQEMTVTYTEYRHDKDVFFRKHRNDFDCETSPMDEYGRYHKTYTFKDGAIWYETMFPEYVKQNVEIKLCNVEIEIKMFVTEFWNTDKSETKRYYEKF